jgi:hypothetical protein
MAEHGASSDDVEAVAAVSDALRRAGVRASSEQVARLVLPYRMMQSGLHALRERLAAEVEPVSVFNSAEAARPQGGSDGH